MIEDDPEPKLESSPMTIEDGVSLPSASSSEPIERTRMQWELPWLSVVIPTYGERGVELTRRCITTLQEQHSHLPPEIIVVSDGDEGDVLESLKVMAKELGYGLVRIDRRGFSVACNVGMSYANGALGVFLINNDVEFIEPCLQILADAMTAMNAGIIGCLLLYPDRRIQHAGVQFVPVENPEEIGIPGYFDHRLRFENEKHVDAVAMRASLVTGALMGISRVFIEKVGLLDERFPFSAEDIDACMRSREAGLPSIYCGYTKAIHHEGATRGRTLEEKIALAPDIMEKERQSLEFFFQRWIGYDWSKEIPR